MIALPAWIQTTVSVVGLLAIAGWVVRFLSHYTSKSKELRELDNEVNVTLRAALADQKEARASERDELTRRLEGMTEQIAEAEKRLSLQTSALRAVDRVAEISKLSLSLLVTTTRASASESDGAARTSVGRVWQALTQLHGGGVKAESSATDRASLELGLQGTLDLYDSILRLNTQRDVGLEMVRFVIDEAVTHPELPIKQVFERMLAVQSDKSDSEVPPEHRHRGEEYLRERVAQARARLLGDA